MWEWLERHPKAWTTLSIVVFWVIVIAAAAVLYGAMGPHATDITTCPVGGLAGC
jgi:hypothetical protein